MASKKIDIELQNQSNDEIFDFIISTGEYMRKELSEFEFGSDEHLDYVLKVKQRIGELTSLLKRFNDEFETVFPKNKDESERALDTLYLINSTLSMLIDGIESFNVCKSFNSAISSLRIENNQLIEYIEDVNEYVIKGENKDLSTSGLLV